MARRNGGGSARENLARGPQSKFSYRLLTLHRDGTWVPKTSDHLFFAWAEAYAAARLLTGSYEIPVAVERNDGVVIRYFDVSGRLAKKGIRVGPTKH